ncbi:MAG: IS3 family transposase [Alphaproteobacteria bacterium]|nr:IS3 family transposase [Alphaproteobacteria bacterium]
MVDFVVEWAEFTGLSQRRLVAWIGLNGSKYWDWKQRYGKANEHNGRIPRDHWLEDWEKARIVAYAEAHPLDGYRRLTFMMLDEDVVAVSPSSVYRVLKAAGLMERWNKPSSSKGTGFQQPLQPHEHWHVDIAYINICGTFYYLCTVLDGCSRYVVHQEIREAMTEADVELVIQRAVEKFPGAKPRIISDNGPQFIAKDFKNYIRVSGLSHVRTSPHYPQSNGKLERWHHTVKAEGIRPMTPLTLDQARKVVADFVEDYNTRRLHSAIGYVTPEARLQGRHEEIYAERDRKLEAARERRRQAREALRADHPQPPIDAALAAS